MDSIRLFCRLKILDHIFSLMILTLLLGAVASVIAIYPKQAKVMQSLGPLSMAKIDSLYYWNVTGEWPATTKEAITHNEITQKYTGAELNPTEIRDGAIEIEFTRAPFKGQRVSFLPVQWGADKLSPVHWRIGRERLLPGHIYNGRDRTNVSEDLIPDALK